MDPKSAHHQLENSSEDRPYTAFETNGRLYQNKRIAFGRDFYNNISLAFGFTNAVPCFQRIVDSIIEKHSNFRGTYAYIDNITVCGKTKNEHDENLNHFLKIADQSNLTFNEAKCCYDTTLIRLLGYEIENGSLRPNPDRGKPLMELPIPSTLMELRRAIGLFVYYAKCIRKYTYKIKPLVDSTDFLLKNEAFSCMKNIKEDLKTATLKVIDNDKNDKDL